MQKADRQTDRERLAGRVIWARANLRDAASAFHGHENSIAPANLYPRSARRFPNSEAK